MSADRPRAAASHLRDPLPGHEVVAVVGLGAAGRGAARLLSALGKRVIASDTRAAVEPLDLPGLELRLGGNDVGDATAVVLSPGLNPMWPENATNPALLSMWARIASGELSLWSEVELATSSLRAPWVAVGGTDGKSTTAALARQLLAAAGRSPVLGGNSWTAMADVVLETGRFDCAVVEVSAFQTWAGHRMHPLVSVLTNIADDHLDHYATFDDYVAAKLMIHDHLGAGDAAVLYAGDARLVGSARALRARGVRVVLYGGEPADGDHADAHAYVDGPVFRVVGAGLDVTVPVASSLLAGAHNQRNVLAALAASVCVVARAAEDAGKSAGAAAEVSSLGSASGQADGPLAAGLSSFRGLPHRLALVRELDGVAYYNDSKATNVHAAVTGIRSMPRPLVAIVGGVDKHLPLEPLVDALVDRARHVVLIGQIAGRVGACLEGRLPFEVAVSMDDAVFRARASARPGDAVLLAPACSSFDMFRGFEHRGDVFEAAVRAL